MLFRHSYSRLLLQLKLVDTLGACAMLMALGQGEGESSSIYAQHVGETKATSRHESCISRVMLQSKDPPCPRQGVVSDRDRRHACLRAKRLGCVGVALFSVEQRMGRLLSAAGLTNLFWPTNAESRETFSVISAPLQSAIQQRPNHAADAFSCSRRRLGKEQWSISISPYHQALARTDSALPFAVSTD